MSTEPDYQQYETKYVERRWQNYKFEVPEPVWVALMGCLREEASASEEMESFHSSSGCRQRKKLARKLLSILGEEWPMGANQKPRLGDL